MLVYSTGRAGQAHWQGHGQGHGQGGNNGMSGPDILSGNNGMAGDVD